MLDESTEFGARVAGHLREETVVSLTTVTPSGAPLPRPVGFLWDGGENVSVYSQPGARFRNIARNPKVTLNLRGDANGGDIVILSGTAQVNESGPGDVCALKVQFAQGLHVLQMGQAPIGDLCVREVQARDLG